MVFAVLRLVEDALLLLLPPNLLLLHGKPHDILQEDGHS